MPAKGPATGVEGDRGAGTGGEGGSGGKVATTTSGWAASAAGSWLNPAT